MYELLLIDPSYFADFKFFPNTFLKAKNINQLIFNNFHNNFFIHKNSKTELTIKEENGLIFIIKIHMDLRFIIF